MSNKLIKGLMCALIGTAALSVSCRPSGPVTLQYDFWGDQNEMNATQAYMDAYMKLHPNVKINPLHFGANTDFMTKINTLAASHTLPDLGYFFEPNVLQWGMNSQFVDLTDFYKGLPEKLGTLKFVTPDGKIVGISVANEIQVIWYNKKMFDAAKQPYPPADPTKPGAGTISSRWRSS